MEDFAAKLILTNKEMIRRINQTLNYVGLDKNHNEAFKPDILEKRIIRTIWGGDIAKKSIEILQKSRIESGTVGFKKSQASSPLHRFTTALTTNITPQTNMPNHKLTNGKYLAQAGIELRQHLNKKLERAYHTRHRIPSHQLRHLSRKNTRTSL